MQLDDNHSYHDGTYHAGTDNTCFQHDPATLRAAMERKTKRRLEAQRIMALRRLGRESCARAAETELTNTPDE